MFEVGGGGVHALQGVTPRDGRGEHVASSGPSGSGKSTLLNILGCLDRPTRGRYRFDGREVRLLVRGERSRCAATGSASCSSSSTCCRGSPPRERGAADAVRRTSRRRAARARARRRWSVGLAHRAAPPARTSSPAASASGWRSRARSSWTRGCCSPTSPPATSTAPRRRGHGAARGHERARAHAGGGDARPGDRRARPARDPDGRRGDQGTGHRAQGAGERPHLPGTPDARTPGRG